MNVTQDPPARTQSSIVEFPRQLREELNALHNQVAEVQIRIKDLQLETDSEPATPNNDDLTGHNASLNKPNSHIPSSDVPSSDVPSGRLMDLQRRLADRLHQLDD